MDVNSWIEDNVVPEGSTPECDEQAESVLSESFRRCCNHEASNPESCKAKALNAVQLCERTLTEYFHGDLEFEKAHLRKVLGFIDYAPNEISPEDHDCEQNYTNIIKRNIGAVADFCEENRLNDNRLSDEMTACLKRPKFKRLVEYYPIEFETKGFKKSLNCACQLSTDKLSTDLGGDIQRNVSVMFYHVLQQLCNLSLLKVAHFKNWIRKNKSPEADLMNDAMNHTTAMIRYYVKLFCIAKAKEAHLSKDDEHEVWKSLVTELACYAGVNYSVNDETKRYYLSRDKECVVIVKADLEILMTACLPFFHGASIPRIIVQVYGAKDDVTVEQPETGKGDCAGRKPAYSGDEELTESSYSSNIPDAVSLDKACRKDAGLTTMTENNAYQTTKHKAVKKKKTRGKHKHEMRDDSSSTSQGSDKRDRLDMYLPESLQNSPNSELDRVKRKLFVQHASQLMTAQQSLQYCLPGSPHRNKGNLVIGLFMHNEKIFFTKLTGSEETGNKFTVSDWCLHMDRFADRVLLMLFMSAYCMEPINVNL